MSEPIYRLGAIGYHHDSLLEIGKAATWYSSSELPVEASYLERVLEALVTETRVNAELGPWGQELLRQYRNRHRCDGNHAAATPCSDPECWQKP